jgi:hypothetical protein
MICTVEQSLAQLTQPDSREFVRNWFAIRGDAVVPARRNVDPSAIARLLPHVWMWEYAPERGDFVCRLAGEAIIRVFQRSPRGLTMGEWVPGPVAEVARPRYRRVLDGPSICIATGTSYVAGDKHAWCERVITPLTNGGSEPSIVFGITAWREAGYSAGPIEREDTEAVFLPLS